MDWEETIRIFCGNVRFLRLKHKLSQVAFSSMTGIGVNTLRRIETGGPIPSTVSVEFLCRLCSAFHVSPDALLHQPMAEADTPKLTII